MKINFFLKNDEIFIHFNFKIVTASFDFGFKLKHLFLLIVQECSPLIISILLPQILNSLSLLNFKDFQLFSIVHCFFDSFINCHELLVILHLLQLGTWLNLYRLNSSIKLDIQQLHPFLMLILELLNLDHRLIFELGKLFLPIAIKFL
jgi:hypothetical protein